MVTSNVNSRYSQVPILSITSDAIQKMNESSHRFQIERNIIIRVHPATNQQRLRQLHLVVPPKDFGAGLLVWRHMS